METGNFDNVSQAHQLDIALTQLEKACILYFEGDHICALTLAGAAEGILGDMANTESKRLLGRKGKKRGYNALNFHADMISGFLGENYFDYIKRRNRLKTGFKHAISGYTINLYDLELTTKQFIGDAITNYKLLSKTLPSLTNIAKFCEIVGVS